MINWNKYPYTDFHELNLDWILSQIKMIMKEIDNLDDWKREHQEQYDILLDMFNKLNDNVNDIISGNFPESIKEAFHKWMEENAKDIVGNMIKTVWFGLNDDGHFVAYIPDSWKELIFRTTGYDITVELMPEYGHLVINY